MIPLKDENPTRSFPFITLTIILINISVFIYELKLGSMLENKIYQFGFIPYNLIHSLGLETLFTLVTSLFFHASFFHLIGNMLYLWIFGDNIEDRLGHLRFLFFYLLCGTLASFAQVIANPFSRIPMIGASGAISGVLSAYLVLYPKADVFVLVPLFYIWRIIRVKAFWFLIFWIILQFFYGTGSYLLMEAGEKGGVAWFAHIGGFFSGILLLGVFDAFFRSKRVY
ncbi:MAG: rhomboid family intramembrane serine protease [Candidatus Omnitrophica bacterium]|nr:rhomboid family intramembrane serine protease [Candidatus Omnitrophota bacterium]